MSYEIKPLEWEDDRNGNSWSRSLDCEYDVVVLPGARFKLKMHLFSDDEGVWLDTGTFKSVQAAKEQAESFHEGTIRAVLDDWLIT